MIIALFPYRVSAFAINPALQAQVMREAKAAPTLTSAANISAFNVGNTLGPALGGTLIAASNAAETRVTCRIPLQS